MFNDDAFASRLLKKGGNNGNGGGKNPPITFKQTVLFSNDCGAVNWWAFFKQDAFTVAFRVIPKDEIVKACDEYITKPSTLIRKVLPTEEGIFSWDGKTAVDLPQDEDLMALLKALLKYGARGVYETSLHDAYISGKYFLKYKKFVPKKARAGK